jgi:hypothetical protein
MNLSKNHFKMLKWDIKLKKRQSIGIRLLGSIGLKLKGRRFYFEINFTCISSMGKNRRTRYERILIEGTLVKQVVIFSTILTWHKFLQFQMLKSYLLRYWKVIGKDYNMDKNKSRNNIQDVSLSVKCGCIMCTTIVYQRTADILVCLVCQKLAYCTFIPNSRVTTL